MALTMELPLLQHLLPKPFLARAALTGLASIQRWFKIPVQPPRAQTHSPAGKSIPSRLGLN